MRGRTVLSLLTSLVVGATGLAGLPPASASVAAAPVGSAASVAYVNRIVVLVNALRTTSGRWWATQDFVTV